MRLALLSDPHVDVIDNGRRDFVLDALAETVAAHDTDVLLVAGDVSSDPSLTEDALRRLAAGARRALVVPGNHDAYLSRRQIEKKHRTSYDALARFANACAAAGVHHLPGAPVEIDGWGFAGSMGWYDYSFGPAELSLPEWAYARQSYDGENWQDRKHTAFGVSDPELCARLVEELAVDLRTLGLDESGSGPPSVVLSHHLPYLALVERRGVASWDYFGAFMGSARLGELIEHLPAVRAAFAGHTHSVRRWTSPSGVIAAVAPLGYWGDRDFPRDLDERIGWFEADASGIREIPPAERAA